MVLEWSRIMFRISHLRTGVICLTLVFLIFWACCEVQTVASAIFMIPIVIIEVVILAPTKELAQQTNDVLSRLVLGVSESADQFSCDASLLSFAGKILY